MCFIEIKQIIDYHTGEKKMDIYINDTCYLSKQVSAYVLKIIFEKYINTSLPRKGLQYLQYYRPVE